MKTLSMVLALVLTVAVSAQPAEKKTDFSSISVSASTTADTLSVSDDTNQYVAQNKVSEFTETYDKEDIEKIEEVNDRSTALLLATIVGYAIYILSISGK